MTPFIVSSSSVLLFLLGIALGSFLNVVGLRYKGEGRLFGSRISGRSHCPQCHTKLSWFELVPLLSFVFLLGRCRHCRHAISKQYPIAELLGGLALLLPYYFYFYGFQIVHKAALGESVGHLYLAAILFTLAALAMILIVIIDWRLQIIPDQINIFLGIIGVILTTLRLEPFVGNYSVVMFPIANSYLNHIFGALVGLIFFGIIIAVSRGRAMGLGDLKLIAAMGLMLGWPDSGFVIGLSFIIGALWGGYLLLFKNKKLKQAVPFGPFLVAGFWLTVFFSHDLTGWYFSLI